MITNIDHEYKRLGEPIIQQPLIFNKTKIGENCFIGSGAKIQGGISVRQALYFGANAELLSMYLTLLCYRRSSCEDRQVL